MANNNKSSQHTMRNLLIIVLILAVIGIAYAMLNQPTNRTVGDRVDNAINGVSNGVDNAGNAVNDAARNLQRDTATSGTRPAQ
jgi:hypothetical protein